MEEVWKQIAGMKTGYKISNKARCINPKGKILNPYIMHRKGARPTYSYRMITALYGFCNPSIGMIMSEHFPEIDLSKIENGLYVSHKHLKKEEKTTEEIIKTIQQNTNPKNKKINDLIINYLEKGDNHFSYIMSECQKSFSVISKRQFERCKNKFYNNNINRRKTDIAETYEDLLQDFYIKLMRLLKQGYFDGRKFFSWAMRIITNDTLLFFLNREQFGVKNDKSLKKKREKKTKEENLLQREKIKKLRHTYRIPKIKTPKLKKTKKLSLEEAVFEMDLKEFSLINLLKT